MIEAKPKLYTKEDFERDYAKNSGMSVERLKELGQVAVECGCDEDDCLGFRMVST